MKKAIAIAMMLALSVTMRASTSMTDVVAEETTATASVPKQLTIAEENDDIVVILRQEEVYVWENNWIEPKEITVGYYLVMQENETIHSIAGKLELTDEYLLSANKYYYEGEMEEIEILHLVKIPDADWKHLSAKVYCLTTYGNYVYQLAEYFYTDVDSILSLNTAIKDPDEISTSCLIRVH